MAVLHAETFGENMHKARDLDIALMENEFSEVIDEVKLTSERNVQEAKGYLKSVFRRKIATNYVDSKLSALQCVHSK